MLYSDIPGIDKPVSRLVPGTMWINTGNLDAAFAALDAFHAAGGNCFDTAHVYGGGDNERAVGQWIHSRGVRDEVVVLAKGARRIPDLGSRRDLPGRQGHCAGSVQRGGVARRALHLGTSGQCQGRFR